MIRTILVPLDGSPLGDRAIPLAVRVARYHGARIALVTVYPGPTVLPPPMLMVGDPALAAEERAAMERRLERIRHRVARATPVPIEHFISEGTVVDELESAVLRMKPDLVVMSTHGRGGLTRAWLGSVAEGLLRRVHVPVLLNRGRLESSARSETTLPFTRVLIGLDGTPESESVIDEVFRLMGDAPFHLTLAHVVSPAPVMMASLVDEPAIDQVRTHYLEPLAARLRDAKRSVTVFATSHNSAARALVELAASDHSDLIALRTHGRHGIPRVVLGSVTDKVIRMARVPVLVLAKPGA